MKLPNIYFPKPKSHKGDNGRLLIIAGSEKYHGSLLYAVKAASRLADLIYILSTRENQKLIAKLRYGTAEFIPVGDLKKEVDCVLIGPGMGVSRRTYELVRKVLKSRIKVVLDADALNVMDQKLKKLLHPNCILTPHRGEFKRLFVNSTNLTIVKNVERLATRYNCVILLKGPEADIIAAPEGRVKLNSTGNQGMTKGGTGDVLAGLVAGLFTKNDAYTSALVGAHVNGKAGDELYKKVGVYYNAEDLVNQIPNTLWSYVKSRR